jgi:hypothetical protein
LSSPSLPITKKSFLECRLFVCMNVHLSRLNGFYSYSVCKSLSVICRCPTNMNILARKYGVPSDKPPKQNGDFLENVYKGSDYISVLYGDYLPKNFHRWSLHKNNGTRTRAPNTKGKCCRNQLYRSDGFNFCSVLSNQ